MKKIVLLMLVMATAFTMNAQKFGHIDSQVLLLSYETYVTNMTTFETEKAEWVNMMEAKQKELEDKYMYYQNNPPMTDATRNMAQQELGKLQQDAVSMEKTAGETMETRYDELIQPLLDEVENAIKKVGADNGFTYIFDSSVGVILYEGGEDVLPLVQAELGIEAAPAE